MNWNALFLQYLINWNKKLLDDNSFLNNQEPWNDKTIALLKSISEKY